MTVKEKEAGRLRESDRKKTYESRGRDKGERSRMAETSRGPDVHFDAGFDLGGTKGWLEDAKVDARFPCLDLWLKV